MADRYLQGFRESKSVQRDITRAVCMILIGDNSRKVHRDMHGIDEAGKGDAIGDNSSKGAYDYET